MKRGTKKKPVYEEDSEDSSMEDEELELEKAALGMISREKQGKAGEGEEEKKKEFIYNVDAIHERLEDISRVDSQPWEDTLVCTCSKDSLGEVPSVEDDLERELFFYNQAFGSVQDSIEKFDELKTKWRRPTDYFAEMVKSDDHMKRVKEKLLYEKKLGEEQEERRKQREAKKYAKQVQAEKLKERAQAKNKQINSIKEWRKQREKNDYGEMGEGEFPPDFDFSGKGSSSKGKEAKPAAGTRIFAGKTKSNSRKARDKKFGYGGRKSLQKQNDAKSSADDSGWRQGKFGKFSSGKKIGKKGSKNRPGKARRQAMQARKHSMG